MRSIVCSSLLLTVAMLAGCWAAVAAGGAAAGTYVYLQGKLESSEQATLDKAHAAALAAVKELEFELKSDRKDAVEGRVVAEKADGDDITISLKRETEKTTKVTIRVGTFGNESLSTLILETMRKHY
jgi:PDZ domain-containing secreted protein